MSNTDWAITYAVHLTAMTVAFWGTYYGLCYLTGIEANVLFAAPIFAGVTAWRLSTVRAR